MARSVFRYSLAAFGMVLLGLAASAMFGHLRAGRDTVLVTAQKPGSASTRQAATEPASEAGAKDSAQTTPESTLVLFIAALKAGDTDRAAGFFIAERQGQWREDLALVRDKNFLGVMIGDLERATRQSNMASDDASFARTDKKGKKLINIHMELHSGVWQISDVE